MSLVALPIFVKLAGRPVMLIGEGEAAEAKRRLLARAGAIIVDEQAEAALAIVALDAPEPVVARLRSRGVLVNAVDRPDLCDFTLPAIVDRDPVLVAVGTGGASAGLAAALRQRLETLLPAGLGALAIALAHARNAIREEYPDAGERRRALAEAFAAGGALDPLGVEPNVSSWLRAERHDGSIGAPFVIRLASADPDDLTLRQARALARADCVFHAPDVPAPILDRARADAARIACRSAPETGSGMSVYLEMGR